MAPDTDAENPCEPDEPTEPELGLTLTESDGGGGGGGAGGVPFEHNIWVG